jgi:hypothetical protein
VDLVLCGHDHDYERSWPVRGLQHDLGRDAATGESVDTCRPPPVVTAEAGESGFDTSHGTVHLILGGGGTNAPLDVFGENPRSGMPQAKVITRANRPRASPTPGVFFRDGAEALEDAVWSARRDTVTGYGTLRTWRPYAHHDALLSCGRRRWRTDGDYQIYDTLVLAKERRDRKGG